MQAWKICENGHCFGSSFSKESCPFCGKTLTIQYPDWKSSWKEKFEKTTLKGDLMRTLPRLPWFEEMIKECENQKGPNSNQPWILDEVQKLWDLYKENGVGNAHLWWDVAENIFGRTVYGIEIQLRFIIALDEGLVELGDY